MRHNILNSDTFDTCSINSCKKNKMEKKRNHFTTPQEILIEKWSKTVVSDVERLDSLIFFWQTYIGKEIDIESRMAVGLPAPPIQILLRSDDLIVRPPVRLITVHIHFNCFVITSTKITITTRSILCSSQPKATAIGSHNFLLHAPFLCLANPFKIYSTPQGAR
jgi:hypothetical protein